MDKAQLDDLKQSISLTVSQSENRLRVELRNEFRAELHLYLHQRDAEIDKRLGRLEQHFV